VLQRRSGPGDRAARQRWGYLPAARLCQRVAFNIFLCFFLRMRLRRFLIRDPMSVGTLAAQGPDRHTRPSGDGASWWPVGPRIRPWWTMDGAR
jgi:hypothetical protein